MEDLKEILFVQAIFILLLCIIIRKSIKRKRPIVFHLAIAVLYFVMVMWLVYGYINVPQNGNGGYMFAIEMYSLIIPGILLLLSSIKFLYGGITSKNE